MTSVAYRWQPLEDLTEEDLRAASAELPPLAEVWEEQKDALQGDRALEEFSERLQREWAIETGVIERVYTLDRGITHLLIERGIDSSLIPHDATDQDPELVANMIRDQKSAVEWLFDHVANQRPLSTSFIKQLHGLMTRHQTTAKGLDQFGNETEVKLRHGDYKLMPNNPIRANGSVHEYCPPEQVAPEMERLVELHLEHEGRGVPPEVEAAWLHHRFTQIHPFQDGNGRVARALASLVFIRAGWFPLVINRDSRSRYIDALESADQGDLEPLVKLFSSVQKRAFVGALGIAREVLQEEERVDQVIGAISDLFASRDAALTRELAQVKDVARNVWKDAIDRFAQVTNEIDEAIRHPRRSRKAFSDYADPDDEERRTWHRWQIVESARTLGYFANLSEFSAWVRICIETENGRSEILLPFHAIGQEFRGLIGASMCFYRRQESDAGERQIVDHHTVADEVFQINYKESHEAVSLRFGHWLEQGLVVALETWRRGE